MPPEQEIAAAINRGIQIAWQSLEAVGTVKEVLEDEAQAERFYKKCVDLGIPASRAYCSERLFALVSDRPASETALQLPED